MIYRRKIWFTVVLIEMYNGTRGSVNTTVKFYKRESLGQWASVEIVINISFGLEVILFGEVLTLTEALMNNLNIMVTTMVCVWCEVALLQNMPGGNFNPARGR